MQFLDLVAKDIIARFGNDLSEVVMVFPNIRSRIFFDEYIANATETSIRFFGRHLRYEPQTTLC